MPKPSSPSRAGLAVVSLIRIASDSVIGGLFDGFNGVRAFAYSLWPFRSSLGNQNFSCSPQKLFAYGAVDL